jgi:macrolide transport system ATP-binding/permease protein
MKIIKLSNINKFYGTGNNCVHVLKDISLDIGKGDFIAFVGQSGSGKSTLMNIIGCLDTPTSGSYIINGKEAAKLKPDELARLRGKTFGFIFQRYNLLSSLSAVDNVALPAVYEGISDNERRQKAFGLLKEMELSDKTENKPNEMSGGQQQRVSIARALMNGGEIILADEPTGALDSHTGERVMQILSKLHQEGHTIILVTHDKNIAARASRIIEIKDGRIIYDERRNNEIYNAPVAHSLIPPKTWRQIKDRIKESFKMSVQTIFTHKMRSALTMLGIIIGVGALSITISLGKGAQSMVIEKINEMGSSTININPGKSFGDMESDMIKTLVPLDAQLLSKQSYIASSTPEVSATVNLVYKNKTARAHLSGAGEEFFDVTNGKILKGRMFTAQEVKQNASVAIIDEKVVNDFFPNQNPLGQIIIINKKPLTIIGVGSQPQMFGPYANMLTLWTPYKTAMSKITGMKHIHAVTVRIKDGINIQAAEKDIIRLITAAHGRKDFFTLNSDTVQRTLANVTGILTLLVSGIALIALLVGGIGVMNIMLVSVTERTKEIGIRMAIGATQAAILEQFLIEAVIICLIGGFIGISLSLCIGFAANIIMDYQIMPVSAGAMLTAFISASATGIIFGFMPAKNAAKLNPIEALARD